MTISFQRVLPLGASTFDRDGFVKAFKEAFGGEPYNERYTDNEVIDEVWTPHLRDGSIILGLVGMVVAGFGCAIALSKAPSDVQEFLASYKEDGLLPADFIFSNKTWYMSEMGVLDAYRGQKLSGDLVRHRLISAAHAGATHYVMRTASDKPSNSRRLYEKLGATVLAEQDVSDSDQVKVNKSESVTRVYLYGRIDEAMKRLDEL